MAVVKHSSGPFLASKGTEDEPDRWQVVVDGPRLWIVATIENGAPGDTLKTEGANARLFAAAPDLLEACKALLLCADNDVKHRDIARQAREAIAKAEG
ncbi:MAG: hypothetical protein WBC44_04630 [Planctomycetaceae bacterium]